MKKRRYIWKCYIIHKDIRTPYATRNTYREIIVVKKQAKEEGYNVIIKKVDFGHHNQEHMAYRRQKNITYKLRANN